MPRLRHYWLPSWVLCQRAFPICCVLESAFVVLMEATMEGRYEGIAGNRTGAVDRHPEYDRPVYIVDPSLSGMSPKMRK